MSTASSNQGSRVDEDDDLDDLDDIVDQFSAQAAPQPASAVSPTPAHPAHPATDAHANDPLTDEFAAEFAREMESMFSNLGIDRGADEASQGAGVDGVGAAAQEREQQMEQLAAAWEAMLVEGMNTTSDPSPSTSSSRPTAPDFQSRIRSTLDRLRESESGLQPSNSGASEVGDSLDSLLSKLGGLDGDGQESDEQLQGVLEAMMGQLMSKEVLYEPLKELHEKFPGYLTEHASTISSEDKQRYDAQITCIKRLLDEFDAKSYRDDDERARGKIVEIMGELQTHGSPPEEIMGPLPPGFSLGPDGLPNMSDGCNLN